MAYLLSDLIEPKENLSKSLIDAIKLGDPDKVNQLIDAGADVNHIDRGFTPLMRSVMSIRGVNHLMRPDSEVTSSTSEIINILIDRGAEINAVNSAGNTALMLNIIYSFEPEIIDLLLELGADPTIANREMRDALNLCGNLYDERTDRCRDIISAHIMKQKYRQTNQYQGFSKALSQGTPLNKDLWQLIMMHRDQKYICEELNDPKYIGVLWAMAEILEIFPYKSMTKDTLCKQISKALSNK